MLDKRLGALFGTSVSVSICCLVKTLYRLVDAASLISDHRLSVLLHAPKPIQSRSFRALHVEYAFSTIWYATHPEARRCSAGSYIAGLNSNACSTTLPAELTFSMAFHRRVGRKYKGGHQSETCGPSIHRENDVGVQV